MNHSAAYGEKLEGQTVICHLCPAECRLTEGKYGICGCRFNHDGDLVTENYGELVSLAVDPIEKKPLYHFFPGSSILSTGPNCCNLGCLHCQNWTISQEKSPTVFRSPEQLVREAVRLRSLGVAFTYTEPMVWYEYIMDVAPMLRERGLKVVLVTNGYVNLGPLEDLIGVTDAMNIDLKGMSAEFYARICKGKLDSVLDTIRRVGVSDVHLEITNLVIPGLNDTDAEFEKLTEFVADVSDMIPLHFSAYHPDYKLDREATPPETLIRAKRIAENRLKYVYLGNVWTGEGVDSICPSCRSVLVKRRGFRAEPSGVRKGLCLHCNFETGIRQ